MIGRREFITLLGGAVIWPLAARAQQPALPVIGLLNGVSNEAYADRIAAIRQGLKETGFVEGQNVAIEYRSADGRPERLPGLAAELVRRQVSVIVAIGGDPSPLAAKEATSSIPIVFAIGGDAVELGLVANLSRPGGNVTGMSLTNGVLAKKRLELMRELLPDASVVAFLTNLGEALRSPEERSVRDLQAAARILGREVIVFSAETPEQVDTAFAAIVQQGIRALIVSPDAFLNTRRYQIIGLAARHTIPTIYSNREYVRAGGLMSYGVELYSMYRLAGTYTGRILKGDKSADLPVMLPTKYELVTNSSTAKALGLTVPPTLLAIADEVIE
jgi:putative ABC transport system substrate-binding protein